MAQDHSSQANLNLSAERGGGDRAPAATEARDPPYPLGFVEAAVGNREVSVSANDDPFDNLMDAFIGAFATLFYRDRRKNRVPFYSWFAPIGSGVEVYQKFSGLGPPPPVRWSNWPNLLQILDFNDQDTPPRVLGLHTSACASSERLSRCLA